MSAPRPKLPPLRWIASALRTTTETLARELAAPSARAPQWTEAEWRLALAAAAIHGISPLLARRLRWRGPAFWNAFLEQQREHTRRRQLRIAALIQRIDEAAQRRGLAVLALKGAALHDRGWYRIDERPMADVDLLVSPEDRSAAGQMIESLNYRFRWESPKHLVFAPTSGRAAPCIGEHADNPIQIELHMSVAERMPRERVDITHLLEPSFAKAGLSFYSRPAAMMMHLLVHAAGAIVFRSLRALHLQDVATIARRMGPSDWCELASMQGAERAWWAYPPLVLADAYFPGIIPSATLHTAESMCPMMLRAIIARRTLADVSVSAPYVHAFPGIEWSRSPSEALRYMYERVRPNAETLELRERFGEYQTLGNDFAWVHQSQIKRIARFVVSHPPRIETIATVRAALLGG